jgi:hypothetical protein
MSEEEAILEEAMDNLRESIRGFGLFRPGCTLRD